jgi:hypothetical protein
MIGDRWGVRPDEVVRRYACDDIVPAPVLAAYRGVTVHARPAGVWPWIKQIRLAPYSYDWVDNLGRRSPQELRVMPEPAVGEPFSCAFGRPAGRIVSVSPGEQLTAQIVGTTMSYLLVPEDGSTRLLLKVVTARGRLVGPLVSLGDLVMARRQLLNLKRLAEGGNDRG